MGKKTYLNLLLVFGIFTALSIIIYYPLLFSKIPINGNLLVALWSPWKFLKWPDFPAGLPFKFMGVDEIREFYPLLDFTYDSLRSGQIPLWNPYNFSGYSHLGNWASAVFYPLHLAMFILGKVQVLIFLKISAIILSGFFTYLYLRSIMLEKASSFSGSVAFAFSATMLIWGVEIWQSVHSFLWLPLTLYAIEKILQTKRNLFIIPLSLSIAFSIMGGYIQPTIYLFLFSGSYTLFRLFGFKNKNLFLDLIKILVGFFLGVTLSAIQLFPGIEAYILSPRSMIQLKDLNISFLLSVQQAVTLIIPDFFGHVATQNWLLKRPGQYYENMIYVGLIPFILVSFSFLPKNYRKYALFLSLWSIISLLFVFDSPVSRLIYDFSVPFLSSAIPIRIVFVLAFTVSVLSAIGIEWWFKYKKLRKILIALFPMMLIFSVIGIFVIFAISQHLRVIDLPNNWYFISARNFIIPSVFFSLTVFILLLGQVIQKYKNTLIVILAFLVFSHAFIFLQKYIAFSDKKFLYPVHPLFSYIKANQGNYRYWGYGSAAIINNLATIYKLNTVEGYDPVNIQTYNRLLSSTRFGKDSGIFSRSDSLLFPAAEFPFKDVNDERYKLMDFLGIKFIGFEKGDLEKIDKKRLDPNRFSKVWDKENFIIFENKNVLPRTLLVEEEVVIDPKAESLTAFYDKKFDISKQVILDKNIYAEKGGKSDVKILEYNPNKVVVKVRAEKSKILVLSDAYYPGWKATLDGIDTEVLKANYAFRAISVPKGEHEIIFLYKPLSFMIGIIISAISSLVLIFIFIWDRKKYGFKT